MGLIQTEFENNNYLKCETEKKRRAMEQEVVLHMTRDKGGGAIHRKIEMTTPAKRAK